MLPKGRTVSTKQRTKRKEAVISVHILVPKNVLSTIKIQGGAQDKVLIYYVCLLSKGCSLHQYCSVAIVKVVSILQL